TGATEPNYQAPSLTDTTYYRRVATSGTIIDRGNVIRINVQNLITNNIITGADLITCINNEAAVITGTTVSVGGDNVNYEYVWQFKEDDTDWNTITNSQNTNTSFYPGTITDTSFVRRIVISGACRDTVSPGLEITGLPQIENNQINAIDEICYGEIPSEITGSLPIKGIGTYTYQWQQKNTNTAWTDINLATQQNYSPSNLYDTTIYRRLVYSDDCIDESDPDTVIVLSPITNNNIAISSPNSTCYNTTKQIDATLPAGAKNVYQYQWQESSDGLNWVDITSNANEQNYLSYNLTNRTFFRRHITSGACESVSTNIQININPLPIAILNDFTDTVCGESDVQIVVNITGGAPTYSIVYTDGNENYQQTGLSENQNTITINPNTLQESETLNYSIIAVQDQNGCLATDITGSGDIYVYGNPNANPGINAENCSFIFQMQAVPSLGNGVWSIIDQPTATSSVFENNLQANTNVTVNEAGMYTYQWKETNWQCVDSANVSINFYEQLQNVDAGEKIVKLFY
ncbi:MAG: hypothetical protein MI739_11670, partial [Bacteroidales bacterium]|nr:hypothetical protein [Bacteroidales bacterium]